MFSREIKVHCWACSSTGSPKSRCSIVLGFDHSLSLVSVEVEDEESSGSIAGPDDKPGPVSGSGGGDGEGSGGGNGGGSKVFCILDIAGFGGVGGRFPGGALSGGDRERFGGAAARRVVSVGAPVWGSGSACSTNSAI